MALFTAKIRISAKPAYPRLMFLSGSPLKDTGNLLINEQQKMIVTEKVHLTFRLDFMLTFSLFEGLFDVS
jgi:hypothetical protein